jgi:glycolate oxidase FAD binding subunit
VLDLQAPEEVLDLDHSPLCVSPESADEGAAILRDAGTSGRTVVPWGGGTEQRLGAPPSSCDIVLDTRRLSGIVAYAPDDLTVSVHAGTTLAEVGNVLAAHGQFLPFDVAQPERATIGGVLAANTASIRRYRYGAARDLLIGVTAALPSGELCKAGGRVVKNVAGYDLCKLWVGSLGTLGVITSANFRVQPTCKASALITGRFRTWESAVRSGLSLAGQGHVWSALFARGGQPPTLLIVAEGFDGSVKSAIQAAKDAAAGEGGESTVEQDVAASAAALRDLARHCGGGATRAGAAIRGSVAPGRLVEAIGVLCAYFSTSDLSVDWQADIGVGSLFAQATGTDDALVTAIKSLRAALVLLGGSLVVSDGSSALRQAVDPWGAPEAAAPLAKAIKARLDPNGTLNPGRYCYGL